MRDYLKFYVPIAVLLIVGFALASRYINPAPPRQVRIASGASQGGYAESARRYREILARDGITLEVVATSGSMENLKLRAGSGHFSKWQPGGSRIEPAPV